MKRTAGPERITADSLGAELSPRQREILDFIVAQVAQTGVVPSYREIGGALGIESTNAVSDHLKALTRKGYIERVGEPGRPRSLRLTEHTTGLVQDDQVTMVPILGRIAAGVPLQAVENYESSLRLDQSMLPPGGKVFGLVVTGDSMIEDGILDGDTLFVRQKEEARDGEIAVVMVDGDATVKRVFREGDKLRLQPANASMAPILVDRKADVKVIGVAVGVWRKIRL
ncbi:MAG: transcriptional repressor LexA [Myxococcota bacterium]